MFFFIFIVKDGIEIVQKVNQTGRLLSLDLVEINPKIGTLEDVDVTLKSGMKILENLVNR